MRLAGRRVTFTLSAQDYDRLAAAAARDHRRIPDFCRARIREVLDTFEARVFHGLLDRPTFLRVMNAVGRAPVTLQDAERLEFFQQLGHELTTAAEKAKRLAQDEEDRLMEAASGRAARALRLAPAPSPEGRLATDEELADAAEKTKD